MVASQHAIVVGESMHSCVNMDSLTGGPVYSHEKWNSPHGGQVPSLYRCCCAGIKWTRVVFSCLV